MSISEPQASQNPKSHDSGPVETQEKTYFHSVCAAIEPEELKPDIEAVERYFGGSSYTADFKTRAIIEDAIHHACRIVSPLMVFAINPVWSASAGTLNLSGGQMLPLPDGVCDMTARFLAAVIGTLGKELETECRLLARKQNIYQSMLLDAVGTAMLDAMDIKIRTRIDAEIRPLGVCVGIRFAPGLNEYPMDHQQTLFQLADGSAIEVRLNDA
ncbi:MAG: hypothetical protein WA151_17290, partial [Desulfatirhabdiaceae bacterium]